MNLLLITIEQGLIYAILAMGVYLSFKILKIPDMTVEGTFPLGAMVTANLLLRGLNPFLVIVLVFFIGLLPGLVSQALAIKLKIKPILAGILTMTMLYSINLRVNGLPNVPMNGSEKIFDINLSGNAYVDRIIILAILVILIKIAIDLFLNTKMGYMLISSGDNQSLVKSLGEDPDKYKLIGLGLANGLVALAGSLFSQSMKVADSQMGAGILVIALASIIIGDSMLKKIPLKGSLRAILGALIYKLIGSLAIEAGLNPVDLKLINALILIIFIAYNKTEKKILRTLFEKGASYVRN
ncbi:MAG: ABC transporter permease [Bacillota bacterium]|nr:ABC transporter permease [Bacillota bacterium]